MTKKDEVFVDGEETVVRRPGAGWCFTLPEQHTIELTDDCRYVSLATPRASTLFAVEGIDDSGAEEVVVWLGEVHGRSGPPSFGNDVREALGYPLPEIQDEFARLKTRWERAGGNLQRFNAWEQGASWESHLE